MSIVLQYNRHARRGGVDGALFKVAHYNQPKDLTRFFSYKDIQALLQSNSEAAEDYTRIWHPRDVDAQGNSFFDKNIIIQTGEFRRAMSGHAQRLCRMFDREAYKKQARPMELYDVTCEAGPELMAVFKHKRRVTMFTGSEIRGMLAGDDAQQQGYYFSDKELIDALEGLQALQEKVDIGLIRLSNGS